MARKYLTIRGEGAEYRLRLTLRGQRELRERFGEDTLQTVLLAASDSERMSALLEAALNWEHSGNLITDGEVFYDLLVDWGYRGQARFGELAFDLAAASGLITDEQARQLKRSLSEAMEQAFEELSKAVQEPEQAGASEAPFPAN